MAVGTMTARTASDRLAIAHQKDVAAVAGTAASAVISTALGADPIAISTWFYSALDGLLARIQTGYALNRRSALGYLPQHGALNGVTVSPVPGSLDVGSARVRLNITGPVAFKRGIATGLDQHDALRSMAGQMGGVADELVRDGDRDVITHTIRHGRGLVAYRRRLSGKSCGFCAMLASRGAVYSAESVNFRTHAHCRCWAEPVYRHQQEPPEVQRLQRQWRRVTAGEHGDDAVRVWRRHWEQRATPKARAREGIRELMPAPATAAVADPGLKLTIAQLKSIAGTYGVPLLGGTRKADILAVLRNHEDLRKVKLSGLPEWKPPKAAPPPIDAPPLGVPPVGRPVLSGDALNDWADYFKHDLEQGRHQFVDAAGNTAAEGVRVKDLRTAVPNRALGIDEYHVYTGTAWRFDGVAYLIEHGEADFGAPWVSRALRELRDAHQAIPAAARANRSYAVLLDRSPADPYWARVYRDPGHRAAMSAGNGHISIWQFKPGTSRVDVDLLRHETGHNLDTLLAGGRHHGTSGGREWLAAVDADATSAAKIKDLKPTHHEAEDMGKVRASRDFPKGVTRYGRSNAAEDYAESVMLYQLGPIATGRLSAAGEQLVLYFRDIYPKRAALLDKVFPDIAKAQKAQIKALRAPKPVTKPAAPPIFRDLLTDVPARSTVLPSNQLGLDGSYGGLELRISRATVDQADGVRFKGDIFNPVTGEKVGRLSYKVGRDKDGILYAHHEMVEIEPRFQGSGFATQLDGRLEDIYRASGVRYINLGASDVGSYTWATRGFDFRDSRALTDFLDRMPDLTVAEMRKLAPSLTTREIETQLAELKALVKRARAGEPITAHEFSQLGRATRQGRDDTWLGKTVMLKNHWLGRKDLVAAPTKAAIPQLRDFDRRAAGALRGESAADTVKVSLLRESGLTDPEIAAIRRYRGIELGTIQDSLRATLGRAESPPVRIIDAVMSRSPLPRDVVVWRGLKLGEDVFGPAWRSDMRGVEWADHGYLSTTTSKTLAKGFSQKGTVDEGTGAVLELLVPRGTRAIQLSDISGESEILLGRGLKFRVVSDTGFGPGRVLKVEVLPATGADLSKLKVPELRALAKERGVTGYSKLTKPQLLERLGKPPAPLI